MPAVAKVYKHMKPMLSLNNTYTEDELNSFHSRVQKLAGTEGMYSCLLSLCASPFFDSQLFLLAGMPATAEYVTELKYDGNACNIQYKNGKLHMALSRGDGIAGQDIYTTC